MMSTTSPRGCLQAVIASNALRKQQAVGVVAALDAVVTVQRVAVYPDGITLQSLLGKTYAIYRDIPFLMYHSFLNGDWEVESVAVCVNDQLLCADNFNKWLLLLATDRGSESVVGRFTSHSRPKATVGESRYGPVQ
jgi:hypothetical protein